MTIEIDKRSDKHWMEEALKEAKKAFDLKEVPIGAVAVCDGHILARGHNQVELLKDATAHAEMLCLTAAASALEDWRLKSVTLYCTLEPCLMCLGAMHLSRIARLVYGAPDLRHGALGSWVNVHEKKHPIHEFPVDRGVLEAECADLMRRFFQERRQEKSYGR